MTTLIANEIRKLEALTLRLRRESLLILDLDPAIALVDDRDAYFVGRLEPAVETVRVMEGVDRGLTVRPEAGELLADEDFLRFLLDEIVAAGRLGHCELRRQVVSTACCHSDHSQRRDRPGQRRHGARPPLGKPQPRRPVRSLLGYSLSVGMGSTLRGF